MEALFVEPVIQQEIEAAGHADYKLVQVFMRMFTTVSAAWHVIQIVDPLDVKGDMIAPFDKGQVASGICHLGQVHNVAIIQRHGFMARFCSAMSL